MQKKEELTKIPFEGYPEEQFSLLLQRFEPKPKTSMDGGGYIYYAPGKKKPIFTGKDGRIIRAPGTVYHGKSFDDFQGILGQDLLAEGVAVRRKAPKREVERCKVKTEIARTILYSEYKIHLMPKPEYILPVIERILMAAKNDPELANLIAQFKIYANAGEKRGKVIQPNIVIYPRLGEDNARQLIHKLQKLFLPFDLAEIGESPELIPRRNVQINNLLYYSQGGSDVKQEIIQEVKENRLNLENYLTVLQRHFAGGKRLDVGNLGAFQSEMHSRNPQSELHLGAQQSGKQENKELKSGDEELASEQGKENALSKEVKNEGEKLVSKRDKEDKLAKEYKIVDEFEAVSNEISSEERKHSADHDKKMTKDESSAGDQKMRTNSEKKIQADPEKKTQADFEFMRKKMIQVFKGLKLIPSKIRDIVFYQGHEGDTKFPHLRIVFTEQGEIEYLASKRVLEGFGIKLKEATKGNNKLLMLRSAFPREEGEGLCEEFQEAFSDKRNQFINHADLSPKTYRNFGNYSIVSEITILENHGVIFTLREDFPGNTIDSSKRQMNERIFEKMKAKYGDVIKNFGAEEEEHGEKFRIQKPEMAVKALEFLAYCEEDEPYQLGFIDAMYHGYMALTREEPENSPRGNESNRRLRSQM